LQGVTQAGCFLQVLSMVRLYSSKVLERREAKVIILYCLEANISKGPVIWNAGNDITQGRWSNGSFQGTFGFLKPQRNWHDSCLHA
jgi:hypothetical protein